MKCKCIICGDEYNNIFRIFKMNDNVCNKCDIKINKRKDEKLDKKQIKELNKLGFKL